MTIDHQDHEQRPIVPINDDTRRLAETVGDIAEELHRGGGGD